jgi:hypothetical protein
VDGTLRATGNISTSASLRADSLTPLTGTVVTATNDFTVTGTTRCDVFKGRAASEVTCQDNLTVQGLTVCQGGLVSSQAMAAQSILCQTDITVHGNIVGWSPFFCAGRVNGITAAAGSSIGRVGYTVSRPSTHPTSGVIQISFASPAPHNNYVIHLAAMYYGIVRILDSSPPSVNGFLAVMSGSNWSLTNGIFHFSVTM